MAALAAGLALVGCGEPTEVTVWRNATFSADGASVLTLGLRYQTTRPSAPYYNDPSGQGWTLLFQTADTELAPIGEPLAMEDPGQGGGPLFSPLWWFPEQRRAIALFYDVVSVVSLDDGDRIDLRIPVGEVPALFAGQVDDERGLVVGFAPSPDGRLLAVFYRLVVLVGGDIPVFETYDAIAFFSLEGRPSYLGALPLLPWQREDAVLRLDPPLPVTDPGPAPPNGPPEVDERRPLLFAAYFLWSDASDAVYVIDRGDDIVPENRVARITAGADPSLRMLAPDEPIPGAPVPTRGGGARDDGLAIYMLEPFDEPNAGGLSLDRIDPWPGFEGRGSTTVSALDYGF